MVARISFPKRLLAALNYNENKCSKENAECIAAVNYLLDANEMNFHQKLSMLELRDELNDRATTKTIHVSLNFDPSENLSKEKLCSIAETYMKGIGFDEQPYLVYQHHDAGHPHLHIVSTTIREDGSRINTHNLGRNQSEKARKEIEEAFGLVKAERQKLLSPGSCTQRPQAEHQQRRIKAIDADKIIYGKSELKRSISNVVSYVFNNYRFSSLPEYNAALKQFNVIADRGKEDGRIYKYGGLVYRVLDEKGDKVGVPIKASLIACQPTLENLEKKFAQKVVGDATLKHQQRHLTDAIDGAVKTVNSIEELVKALKKKNIFTVLRRSEVVGEKHQQRQEGRIYGITFVDNENKVVFNGSDLGKGYSAASLLKRLEEKPAAKNATKREEREVHCEQREANKKHSALSVPFMPVATKKEEDVFEVLLSAEQQQFNNIPFQLRRKKKKKKRNKQFNT
jgi:hypothetical protein